MRLRARNHLMTIYLQHCAIMWIRLFCCFQWGISACCWLSSRVLFSSLLLPNHIFVAITMQWASMQARYREREESHMDEQTTTHAQKQPAIYRSAGNPLTLLCWRKISQRAINSHSPAWRCGRVIFSRLSCSFCGCTRRNPLLLAFHLKEYPSSKLSTWAELEVWKWEKLIVFCFYLANKTAQFAILFKIK